MIKIVNLIIHIDRKKNQPGYFKSRMLTLKDQRMAILD